MPAVQKQPVYSFSVIVPLKTFRIGNLVKLAGFHAEIAKKRLSDIHSANDSTSVGDTASKAIVLQYIHGKFGTVGSGDFSI